MKTRGFTMIELLAIITILATILLVSFPTLINMTRKDKERQYNDMVTTLCKAGETYIYDNKDLYPELNTSGEEFYVRIGSLMEEELVSKSQTNPKNANPINQNLLKYKVKSDKSLSCSYLERSLATLISDTGEEGLSVGDKYTYEVSPGKKYTFYVLSKEGDNVNLIMDRNICEDGTVDYENDPDNNYCRYAWEPNSINANGPTDAMTELGNATRNWTNVPNVNLEYNDITDNTNSGYTGDTTHGYTGVTITDGVGYITKKDGTTQTPITITDNKPIKARLPKYSEITGVGCTISLGSCPVWLVGYMTYYNVSNDKYSINNNSETYQNQIYGYWLFSSDPGNSSSARTVNYKGSVGDTTSNGGNVGVRPVITVSQSDLSN